MVLRALGTDCALGLAVNKPYNNNYAGVRYPRPFLTRLPCCGFTGAVHFLQPAPGEMQKPTPLAQQSTLCLSSTRMLWFCFFGLLPVVVAHIQPISIELQ